MISCTFIRIKENIFNANCIKNINFSHKTPDLLRKHGFCYLIITFTEDVNQSPISGFCERDKLSIILFDWKCQSSNYFEIEIYDTDYALELCNVEEEIHSSKNDLMEDLPPPLYEKFLQEHYSKDVQEEVKENYEKYIRDKGRDLSLQ